MMTQYQNPYSWVRLIFSGSRHVYIILELHTESRRYGALILWENRVQL